MFAVKICHNTLLIQTEKMIYISRFKVKLNENAIIFEVVSQLDKMKYQVQDTVDCNFLNIRALTPEGHPYLSTGVLNIFYDTANHKFERNVCSNNYAKFMENDIAEKKKTDFRLGMQVGNV